MLSKWEALNSVLGGDVLLSDPSIIDFCLWYEVDIKFITTPATLIAKTNEIKHQSPEHWNSLFLSVLFHIFIYLGEMLWLVHLQVRGHLVGVLFIHCVTKLGSSGVAASAFTS